MCYELDLIKSLQLLVDLKRQKDFFSKNPDMYYELKEDWEMREPEAYKRAIKLLDILWKRDHKTLNQKP